MVYKRYYSPFEEPKINETLKESEIITPKKIEMEETVAPVSNENNSVNEHKGSKNSSSSPSLFDRIGFDDLIILGILIILLMEDKENRDVPMIMALGFLLLIGYIEAD